MTIYRAEFSIDDPHFTSNSSLHPCMHQRHACSFGKKIWTDLLILSLSLSMPDNCRNSIRYAMTRVHKKTIRRNYRFHENTHALSSLDVPIHISITGSEEVLSQYSLPPNAILSDNISVKCECYKKKKFSVKSWPDSSKARVFGCLRHKAC